MTLSKLKIQTLKKQSHHLQPVILLGSNGLTDNVNTEIERALYDHELIKIKLHVKDKAEKSALAKAICEQHGAALITQIGHVIAIYKKSNKHQ